MNMKSTPTSTPPLSHTMKLVLFKCTFFLPCKFRTINCNQYSNDLNACYIATFLNMLNPDFKRSISPVEMCSMSGCKSGLEESKILSIIWVIRD